MRGAFGSTQRNDSRLENCSESCTWPSQNTESSFGRTSVADSASFGTRDNSPGRDVSSPRQKRKINK